MNTQVEIKVEEQTHTIQISGPFSDINNKTWRNLGGKFSGGAWVIPDNDTSRSTIVKMFGSKSDIVEALVPADKALGYDILHIGGYVLASRRFRDSQVKMPLGVSLAEGKFPSHGGSRKSPKVDPGPGVVFRLACRKSFAEANNLELAPPPGEYEPVVEV